MKNRTLVVTLVAVMVLSLGLAPASHAIVHPILIALPLAAAFGAAGLGVKAHKANNQEQNAATVQEEAQPEQDQSPGLREASSEAQ